jgi:hypothetical protein
VLAKSPWQRGGGDLTTTDNFACGLCPADNRFGGACLDAAAAWP